MDNDTEISVAEILKYQEDFFECARSFRQDANRLMLLMSQKFSIDLNSLDGLGDLKYRKSNKQRGNLNEYWNYFLHGAECRFENVETGQIVEIIITTFPEFGCLDGYFLFNYMMTTGKFNPLAEHLRKNYMNVWKAIDVLAEEGILTKLPHLAIKRNVVAI
ncbi:MAG TPA: hypothetical protein VNU72_11125 [Puia sp.]|nr:hypothetical protein [Puia sp.]